MTSPIALYLSRHGQTLNNKLQEESGVWHKDEWVGLPEIKDLTDEGKAQAQILAQYAGLFLFDGIQKDKIAVLSSGEQRSNDTAEEIVRYNRLPLYNFKQEPTLREQVPKEIITPPHDASEGFMRWYASLKTMDELAAQFTSGLKYQLKRLQKDIDCRAAIAPLHGNINAVFLDHIGAAQISMGNCSIIPIRYEDGRFKQTGKYITNDEMKKFLEE